MTHTDHSNTGTFYGIGVGPGDPELITLKAIRTIKNCQLLVYLQSDQGNAMARNIAATAWQNSDSHFNHEKFNNDKWENEYAIVMPMSNDRKLANKAYDDGAQQIARYLDQGKDVAFLCLGDPLFFGSFSYLYDRLVDHYLIKIIPGITSISASAALTGTSLGLLEENIAIVSGRRTDQDILETLENFDNVAIMKPGRRRKEIIALIKQSGRAADTCYIEYAGLENQKIVRDLSQLDNENGPYFSLFLINSKSNHSFSL